MSRQVIRLHPAAPEKPAETAPCNGCGVCCAAEPCPIGVLVSGRRSGACAALSWHDDAGLYRCGLVADPRGVLPPPARRAGPGREPPGAPLDLGSERVRQQPGGRVVAVRRRPIDNPAARADGVRPWQRPGLSRRPGGINIQFGDRRRAGALPASMRIARWPTRTSGNPQA